jgi:hypothetical protein
MHTFGDYMKSTGLRLLGWQQLDLSLQQVCWLGWPGIKSVPLATKPN